MSTTKTSEEPGCGEPGGPCPPDPDDPALLHCHDLVVGHSGNALLPPVELELRRGEFWVVLGRNGSGKTTWFKTLLGLYRPIAGQVGYPGGPIDITYVAQRASLDALYPVSARQVVADGTLRGWSFLRPWAGDGASRVQEALESVDAVDLADRTYRSLSEGQKQRILLARMVASGAPLALLDEPTEAMDAVADRAAMELLDGLRARYHLCLVVVTHYLRIARELADKVLFLDPDGQHVIVGTPDEIWAHEAFRARYGRAADEVVDG